MKVIYIPGSQILAMHLKIGAYSVIILPPGNADLLNQKIFRPLKSSDSEVEMTAEAIFVLSKFDIHFTCLNPKLVTFWKGKRL